ncbi:MAG: CBS domain-containing protein [Acidobacteriia bacterium]|nr:CBS domain-containing protein [Terriglobia bacterium]
MLVSDYMTSELTCVEETDCLLDATMIFLRSTLRHLPVLRGKHLVGVITERDVKQYAPSVLSGITSDEYNRVLETTPISRLMTRDPVTVAPGQRVIEAARLLTSKRIGCLPVVEDGELRGIITTTDMLKLLMKMLELDEATSYGAAASP